MVVSTVKDTGLGTSTKRESTPAPQADNGGAELASEVELQGFAFEGCREPLFFGPGLIDFPSAFSERDLHGLRKRFAEGVGDEQGAFAVFRGAQDGLPALRVAPAFACLSVEGGVTIADDRIDAAVEFHGGNAELPLCS